jgi:phosphoserine aminotransferase
MKVHNFYAGPSILPQSSIDATIKALQNFAGTGLSLAEISHRSKEFDAVYMQAQEMFKELLNIPDGYTVLFLGGGASLQFAMVPFNLMQKKATYVNTGVWASKAMKEAMMFGDVEEIKASDYYSLPKNYIVSNDSDYVHITTNNTIYGTETTEDFDFGSIPLVADMSSDIFSRPVDVSKYAIIYGGAQKNLAPAGLTFVIVKHDVLGKVTHKIPSMMNYKIHIDNMMYNTPPVIPIFTALETLKWIKENGGVEGMQKRNIEKANLLYAEIDRNKCFKGTVAKEDRSLMNICFVMNENYKEFEKEFGDFAASKGMVGLKGHRSVGGFRASTYNALPKESVQALVDAMKEFEAKH